MLLKKEKTMTIIFYLMLSILIILYFYKLGNIPSGFFCDEAEIGYHAYEIINNDTSGFINPFFYKHFHYVVGALPVYGAVFFVKLFGLNDHSVRLSSVFFSLLSLFVLYKIFKKIKAKYTIFLVIMFAFTPIFFHISRINFGHLISFFFLILGYYYYIKPNPWLSGIFFSVSLYGYSGFILGTSGLIFSIILTEIFINRYKLKKYKNILIILFILFLSSTPILKITITNSQYLQRLSDKNQNSLDFFTKEKIINIIKNYPKYYSYDFLFARGEVEMPGSFITRHSVHGAGIFFKTSLIMLIFSFIGLFSKKILEKRYYLPFFILFLIYPLPDIITTNIDSPPYSFSIFSTIIFYPFLIAFGFNFLVKLNPYINTRKITTFLFIFFLIELIIFYKNYLNYPLKSSDYWGWQYGPKEIIKQFLLKNKEYDELFMTGSFNEPGVFLKFYDPQKRCRNCFIGSLEKHNPDKRQLFAIREDELSNSLIDDRFIVKIQNIIYYQDKKPAFYLVEIKDKHYSKTNLD